MFLTLIPKIIPLYLLIALGFTAGRLLKIPKKSIADLLIYIISPVIFFGYVAQVQFTWARALVPLITFALPCILSIIWLHLGKYVFTDNRRYLSAYSAPCSNTGYFGVPIFIALFGTEELGIYSLGIIGYMFFESGPGYFILARGKHGIKESILKALSLPSLYASILGIFWSLSGWTFPEIARDFVGQFRGAYVVLGMMLIGIALSDLKSFILDLRYVCFSYLGKFFAMPLLAILTILILTRVFKIQDSAIIHSIATFACVPVAANLTAYASQLDFHPEKVASMVLISTGIALVHMPFVIPLILSFS